MLKTVLIIFTLFLIILPTVSSAEEAAPASHCAATYYVFLPSTFGDTAGAGLPSRDRKMAGEALPYQADFNGDGCADLAIGARKTRIDGATRGMVEIYYGSHDGLLNTRPQILINTQDPGTNFGFALAAGDFDDDGFSDLAVGDPHKSVNGQGGAGAVYIYYGSAAGLSAAHRSTFHQDTPGVPGGVETGDHFGWSMASGRFNADTYSDLAIGSPYEDIGTVADAGYVIVLYGTRDGLASANAQSFHQDTDNIAGKPEAGVHFGWALAAADFILGGLDDLAIGAPNEDIEIIGKAQGRVHTIAGYPNGLQPTTYHISQQTPGVEGSPEPDDHFGFSVATGDFDNDGKFDLVVGTPHEDLFGKDDVGRIDVFYGRGGTYLGYGPVDTWYQGKGDVPGADESGDFFGYAMAAGDFDGDDYWDLATGVPLENIKSVVDAGALVIMYGSADRLTDKGSHASLMPNPVKDEQLAMAITAGDYNGDGYWDLAAGSPYRSDSGVVLLNQGSKDGLKRAGLLTPSNTPGIIVGEYGRSLR